MKKAQIISLIMALMLSIGGLTIPAMADGPILAAPEGDYLNLEVAINKSDTDTLSYCFYRAKRMEYEIQPGDVIEYDYCISDELPGLGHIDLKITGAPTMGRDMGWSDTDGTGFHTGQDLSFIGANVWAHRAVPFGFTEDDLGDAEKATAGKVLTELQVATHPEDGMGEYTEKTVVVKYDNIVITNNGEEKFVIFRSAEDVGEGDFKVDHQEKSKGVLTVAQMDAAESDAIKAAQLKAIEDASIAEEERLIKMSEEQASREAAKASEEASIAESESIAAAEAANTTEAPADNGTENSSNTIIIIVIVAVVVVALVIVIVVAANKKKK